MTLREAIVRANAALDWIEARQGPLKPDGYACVEATVAEVRAWGQAMSSDNERISEIAGHWYSSERAREDVRYLLARVDALTAERDESVANMTATVAAFARLKANSEAWHDDSKRLHNEYMPTAAIMDEVLATRDRAITEAWAERDAARARAERAEAALRPCALALEYRDGVVCSEFGDTDACASHQVVRGLRKHGVDADRFELENRELRARAERAEAANTAVLRANADEIADLEDVRDDLEAKVNALTAQVAALRRQVRATYGIIHEGLHGGKPTDPEHQEACEKPSCRNARAALAAAGEGE